MIKLRTIKKFIFWGILMSVLVLAGCGQQAADTGDGGDGGNAGDAGVVGDVGDVDTSSWQTYRNEEYGFSVEFPDSWEGYQVNKVTLRWGLDDYDVFSFGFIGEIDMSLFSVSAFTQEKWQKDVSQDTIMSGGRLCENDNYVFAGAKAQDSRPEDIDRYREVDGILASFSCF